MRELRVAITGHRPKDLVDQAGQPLDIKAIILTCLHWIAQQATLRHYDTVTIITGGAQGVDQEMAAMVHSLREDLFDGVRLRSCITLPFTPTIQGSSWGPAGIARLETLVAEADEVIGPLFPTYSVGGLHGRNHRMVDESKLVVGFWNGKHSGGTYACLIYALSGQSVLPKNPTAGVHYRPAYNALGQIHKLDFADLAA
jgi:uncharacterized phage-like protein YoqJ